MRHLHDAVTSLASADSAYLTRVVHLDGFGGRRTGEALLITPNESYGSILGGSADTHLHAAVQELRRTGELACALTVPIGDTDAMDAGLACGGRAELIVQHISTIPAQAWEAVDQRLPFFLATTLTSSGSTMLRLPDEVHGGLGDQELDGQTVAAIPELFRKGGHSAVTESGPVRIFIERIAPEPRMLVLGDVALSHAIVRQGGLLQWDVSVFDERAENQVDVCLDAVGKLGPLDGVVVLSHDIAASCAVIAAALQGSCGYVGALGSRHTQSARANELRRAHMITEEQLGLVHGPVGLDIGARTPEETALAIFAEALMVQRMRTAEPLRSGASSING